MPSCSNRFEKAQTVLWAFLPDGIVLHNSNNQHYIELHGSDAEVWAYLDGTLTLEEIATLLDQRTADGHNNAGKRKSVFETFDQLAQGGFVVETAS